MRIAGRDVGLDHPPFIIAEVAQAHDGSLGMASSFIDIAAECGADAVKFQTHIAPEESTAAEPWRVPFSNQDKSRYDYWERMSFSRESWGFLKARAEEKGLIFLSSAFSVMACDWLEGLNMPAWKVASGEVYNEELLERIERSGRPVILSSGLNSFEMSEKLVDRFSSRGIDVALLHCTTMYPTPPEEIGLNVMEAYRDHFGDRAIVGLSDHSGTPYPGIIAAYSGASIIEAHITFHHSMFGPDVKASLDIEGFKALVKGARFAWTMHRAGVDKDKQLGRVLRETMMFTRSLVARRDLAAGQVITAEDLAYKKPGGGMLFEHRETLIGKILKVDVTRDTVMNKSMVEELTR